LEELFEVLAWQTLKLHQKPIVLLNTLGFYDPMLRFLDHCVEQGMLKAKNRGILLAAGTVDEALELVGVSLA
jgi:predicted Rossmann-fold nucleotide-binding protein